MLLAPPVATPLGASEYGQQAVPLRVARRRTRRRHRLADPSGGPRREVLHRGRGRPRDSRRIRPESRRLAVGGRVGRRRLRNGEPGGDPPRRRQESRRTVARRRRERHAARRHRNGRDDDGRPAAGLRPRRRHHPARHVLPRRNRRAVGRRRGRPTPGAGVSGTPSALRRTVQALVGMARAGSRGPATGPSDRSVSGDRSEPSEEPATALDARFRLTKA